MNRYKLVSILTFMVLFASCSNIDKNIVPMQGGTNESNKAIGRNEQRDEIVCTESKPTGSRIAKKTCRTKREQDEIERMAQDKLGNITKPQSNNPQGN